MRFLSHENLVRDSSFTSYPLGPFARGNWMAARGLCFSLRRGDGAEYAALQSLPPIMGLSARADPDVARHGK